MAPKASCCDVLSPDEAIDFSNLGVISESSFSQGCREEPNFKVLDSRQIYGKRSKAEGVGRKVGKSKRKRFLWHKITEEVETASKILRGAVSLEMEGRIHPSRAGKKEARTCDDRKNHV